MKSIDLFEEIDRSKSYALNAATEFGNLFQPDERFVLTSDADEQMIVHLEFKQKVTLTGVNFFAANAAGDESPTDVSLFANCLNPGFDSLEDAKATEDMCLREADLAKESVTNLRMVKFQKIDSLTVFLRDNNGADVTSINSLSVYGFTVADTRGKELKKVG